MICRFVACGEKNGRPIVCCQLCGRKMWSAEPENCHANCKVVCWHLGERLGDATVTVRCSCKGHKLIERRYAVHACALFGETLPYYRCTKEALSESMDRDVAVCWGCEAFSPAT